MEITEYKSWDIKGIAESVLETIKEEGYEDDLEDVLDYYLRHEVYWSVYTREPDDATAVTELVRQYIRHITADSPES